MTVFQRTAGLTLGLFVFAMIDSTALSDVLLVPSDFPTIQAAINAAQDGDIVELQVGIFKGPGNRDIRFHGKAITVRGVLGAERSIIDAEGTPQEPYRGFIFDSGETTDSVLEGVTICGGATLPGAIADQFNGGALFFREGSATVRNCIIKSNQCGCWGAGVYCSHGAAPILINCNISSNHASDDGGAVFVWNGGSATLINSQLNDNSAQVTGGAVSASGLGGFANIDIINSSLINNQAPFGSAIFGSNVTVTNSIIWGNTGGSDVYLDQATITHSIVQGGYVGAGNLDADPMFVDEAGFDYRLRAGSPAIDASDNTALPAEVEFDLDGNERFQNDPGTTDTGIPGTQVRIADIGPFEFQGSTNRLSTFGK